MLRRLFLPALVLLAVASLARAGLYQPGEEFGPLFTHNFKAFETETLTPLLKLQVEFPLQTPWRAKGAEKKERFILKNTFVRERSLLIQKLVGSKDIIEFEDLTSDELLALSTYLIRLGGPSIQKGIDLLEDRVTRANRRNYLLFSNLATAHMIQGNYSVAKRYLNDIVGSGAAWPEKWDDLSLEEKDRFHSLFLWDKKQFEWNRLCEQYLLKLATLRILETRRGMERLSDSVDALFPLGDPLFPSPEMAVQYIGKSGKYTPGQMAKAEREKLPENAYAVLNQLLYWMPTDDRLVWQFAELMNGVGEPSTPEGYPREAYAIMDKLVFVKKVTGYKDLKDHRQILRAYVSNLDEQEREKKPQPMREPKRKQAKTDTNRKKPENNGTWEPNSWQLLGIGFGTGALVAVFGHWQLRELVRRRRKAPSPLASNAEQMSLQEGNGLPKSTGIQNLSDQNQKRPN